MACGQEFSQSIERRKTDATAQRPPVEHNPSSNFDLATVARYARQQARDHLDDTVKRKYRVFTVVLTCFGSLIVVAAGVIIAANFATTIRVSSQLLGQIVIRSIGGLELALSDHLNAAEDQAEFIADNIRSGTVSFDRPDQLAHFAAGTLAAAPQITGMLVADPHGKILRTRRGQFGEAQWQWIEETAEESFNEIETDMQNRRKPYWAAPVYREALQATLMNYRVPFWKDDTYLGFVAVAISTRALSDLVVELSDPPESNVFLLYGDDKVLAHSYLVLRNGVATPDQPLVPVHSIEDLVIERLDTMTVAPDILEIDGITLGEIEADDKRYGVVTKQITSYGETPILLGAYFDGSGVASLMQSILRTILFGGVVLLLGLGVVMWLSRVLTRPIRQTAEVASAIAELEFDDIDPLPENRFKEINDLATAFNGMLVGLQSFGRYVPRHLVRQLIREHRVGAGIEQRELTVMFTDIAGFTATCEGMTPPDVADFINEHLTLVSNCIEAEGGTIDKYIGDAVMAFWGAPDDVDHPNERAVRAAAALQRALAKDNKQRVMNGLLPVRLRIGIHSGPLIVGDIGSPDRINYTVIGDVVNTTQRLEGLGKEVDPNAESIVLVSRTVKDSICETVDLEEIGHMKVKGRVGEIEVYRLL